jgi:hypothetical protein
MGCAASTAAEARENADTRKVPTVQEMRIDVTTDDCGSERDIAAGSRSRRESLSVAGRRDGGDGPKTPRKRRTTEILIPGAPGPHSRGDGALNDFDAASNGSRTPREVPTGGFADLDGFVFASIEDEGEVLEFVSLVPPRDSHTPMPLGPLYCSSCKNEVKVAEAQFCYHCGSAIEKAPKTETCGPLTLYHFTVKVFRDEKSLLGRGTTGTIYKAIDTMNGQPLAVKECVVDFDDEETVKAMRRELHHLSTLRHPQIVDYYGCRVEASKVMMLMERLECGTLEDVVKRFPQGIPESMVQTFTRQLLSGVVYVHEAGVTHRDIKPANLLLSSSGALKLSDFGSAILHSEGDGQVAGSPAYMPPEVLELLTHRDQLLEYGKAHDVWSVGITVHELLTGAAPWAQLGLNPYALVMQLSSLSFQISPDLSPLARSFLERCLARDRKTRATAEELLSHPFVDE